MPIEKIRLVPYALPFKEPYVSARGELQRREVLLIQLGGDDKVGIGEAVALSLRGGPDLKTLAREMLSFANEKLIGREVASEPNLARLSLQARAALEMAHLDLLGKVLDQPVWQLHNAEAALPVTCNATLPAGKPAEVAKRAKEWAADGFQTFKLKLGTGDDAKQVAAVRKAVGPEAKIRVDANAAWSLEEAAEVMAEIEPHNIELAEQPVEGLEGLLRLGAQTSIPIAADESVVDAGDAQRAKEYRVCDYATVKLAKCGGSGAALAVARQLPSYLSSALDGPVGIAAAAHAAQALPQVNLAHGLATQRLFSDTVAKTECTLEGGELTLPEGPGFGVEIDEQALSRHTI